MDRPHRESRQHNGITVRGTPQPTFATKSALLSMVTGPDNVRFQGTTGSSRPTAKVTLKPIADRLNKSSRLWCHRIAMTEAVIIWVWGLVFFISVGHPRSGNGLDHRSVVRFMDWRDPIARRFGHCRDDSCGARSIGIISCYECRRLLCVLLSHVFHSAVSRGHAARSVDQQSHFKSPIV